MTDKADIVKAWMHDAWSNPASDVYKANEANLAEGFKSYDKDGNVAMDKAGYRGMVTMILSAFPDFKWVLRDARQEGDSVIMDGHFEGTHTGDLDLSAMGAGVIPPSGKKIVWKDASVLYEFEGDKVIAERPYGGSAGVEEFLEPLGVKLPSA